MAQMTCGRTKTFIGGGAIGQWLLVKIVTGNSGKLAVAGFGEEWVGIIEEAAFADRDQRSVILRNAAGSVKCVAGGAFSAGAVVYGRAGGKVDDIATSSAIRVGIALEAATALNDIVEVQFC